MIPFLGLLFETNRLPRSLEKSATKYLFGRKCKDGDFDALLLRSEDADRLEWFANFFGRRQLGCR